MKSTREMKVLLRNAEVTSKASQLQFFPTSRKIHYKLLNKVKSGASIGAIKNDRGKDEALDAYVERSMKELGQILKPDQFYLYTDRSSLKDGVLSAGHIFSFLTNDEAKVIEKSFMSLRHQPGRKKDVILEYKLPHDDSEKDHRTNFIWDVKFVDEKEEFTEFLYNRAEEGLPPDEDVERFITNIPLSELPDSANDIIERVNNFKKESTGKEYILARGKKISLPDKKVIGPASPLNCIVGVYSGIGAEGLGEAPSAQMATTGILNLTLGEKEKDELIRDTGLRREDDERRYGEDDKVSWTNPTKGFKM